MQIQQLVFPDAGRCEIQTEELTDELAPDEVFLRTLSSLVSADVDLDMFTRAHRAIDFPGWDRYKYPYRPGKACICEVVTAKGELRKGQHVFYAGTHATFHKAKLENLIALPDALSLERALFFNVLSDAMTGLRMAPARVGEQVVVIGASVLGNLAAQVYGLTGAGLVSIADYVPQRLECAKACKIPYVFNVGEKPLNRWVTELGRRGAELVVEAVGSAQALTDALRSVAERGIIVLLAGTRTKLELDPYFDIHSRGIALIGAHPENIDLATRERDRPLMLDWLTNERVRVEPLVTQQLEFAQSAQVFQGFREQPGAFLSTILHYPA